MSHADLVARLDALPGHPKAGGGRRARCPAHDDRAPSLSIDTGDGGTLLLHCLAGCRPEDIVTALGATMADLFPDTGRDAYGTAPGRGFLRIAGSASLPRRPAAVGTRSFEARYTDGTIAGNHLRADDGQGDKRIWWDPRGVETKRLALFLSWDLGDADPVVVVEGERATLAVRAAGITAVGTYGTSAMPLPAALEPLRGRSVVLWPDNDEKGSEHMTAIAGLLAGVAGAVRVVAPPASAPKGWDAADSDAGTITELVAQARPPGGMRFRSARDIVEELPPTIEWCWYRFLAFGTIAELDGRAKRAGKTTLTTYLIAAIIDGLPFLGQPTSRTPVVFLTEQPPASLRTALERSGLAHRDDVSILLWHDSKDSKWSGVVDAAVAECERIGARVLVVDTLPQFARIKGDAENDAGAALEAMAPLQAAAADHGLAVLITRHERKSGGDVGESGRGSTAFTGSVDVVLQLRRPDNPPRPSVRVLTTLSRFDETPEEMLVELTDAGYITLDEDSGSLAFSTVRTRIRQILADDRPRTRKEITEALVELGDTTKTTLRDTALSSLVNAGEVAQTGRGVRGDPHLFSYARPVSLFVPHSPVDPRGEVETFFPARLPEGSGEEEMNGTSAVEARPDESRTAEASGAGETSSTDETTWCRSYRAHQSRHRDVESDSAWCELCTPRAAVQ